MIQVSIVRLDHSWISPSHVNLLSVRCKFAVKFMTPSIGGRVAKNSEVSNVWALKKRRSSVVYRFS